MPSLLNLQMKKASLIYFVLVLLSADALNIFRFGKRSTMKPFPSNGAVLPVANQMPEIQLKSDRDISNVFLQNQVWREKLLLQDPTYFQRLGRTHMPKYMWIGCADARVPDSVVCGEDLGQVFTVRNVGNLVVNTDASSLAAIMYGVSFLKIPHIIVCGHYNCGGIKASESNTNHGAPLENWLRNIRDVYRLHQKELDAIKNPEARHRRLVELNVIEQCINLYKTGAVQKQRLETYKNGADYATPRIHPCVFDPMTGDLMRLNVKLENYAADLGDIYNLETEISQNRLFQ